MADKDFGIKKLNFVGASGTPTITSPTDLIIRANNVAISTNSTISGNLGIGTTNPTSKLYVVGDGYFTGVVTATEYFGTFKGTVAAGVVTYADRAGISTNVIGGIASVTSLNVTGITTLASIVGTSLSISGISTLGITSTTNLTSQQLNIAGISTLGVTSTTNLTSQQLLVTGITTLSSIVGTSLSISGITTLGVTSTTNLTTRQLNVSGVSTFNNIVGTSLSITGISTIANFRITNVGTGATVGGIGVVTYYGDGSNLTNVVASSGYATTAGIATNVIGGIASVSQLQVTGISTFTNGPVLIGTGTSTGTAGQVLQVSGINSSVYIGGSVGIGTTIPTSKLHVIGDVRVSGVVTATTFVGNLTGTASTASSVTENSVGLGTDTFGDYVKNISGTDNQITVEAAGGISEGSSLTLKIPNQFTAPQDVTVSNDLQVNRNLNVNGNITIGGTAATLFTQTFKVSDADIILGVRTDGNGNDISTDNTANHGGIAIASTDGNPLVTLTNPGIGETLPATYKKFMWFKAGSFGIGTDAWLSNYAIGIGSTQFPTGTRLAAGSVQFTENDLAVVRNINATGIITATEFKGTLTGYASSAGIATNLNGGPGVVYQYNTGITSFVPNATADDKVLIWKNNVPVWGSVSAGSITGTTDYANKAGIATYADNAGIATNIKGGLTGNIPYQSNTDTTTFVPNATADDKVLIWKNNVPIWGDISAGSIVGDAEYAEKAGIATNVIGGIASVTSLDVSGITTLGVTSTTNLTSQQLLVTGIATLRSIVGTSLSITGISTIANFRITNVGTGATVGGIGVTYYGDGSNLTNIKTSALVGVVTYAERAGIATNVIGGIASITSLNVTGITTLANIVGTSLSITGISTLGVTSTTNLTSRQLLVTGITTLASIVGTSLSITGISTIANFRITNVGTGATVGGIGVVTYYGDGSNLTNIVSGYASTAGIATNATNVIGGIASVSQLNVTGITTLANIVGTSLSITGISTIANFRITNVGTGATVGGIGVVTYYGDGSNLTNIKTSALVGVVTYAERAGIATNVIGGIASITSLNVTGITTLANIVGTSLSITGISTIANFRITPVGTGATVGGIGVVTYYGDGSNLTGTIPNTIEDIDSNQLYYPLLSPKLSGTISSISVSSTSLVFNPATNSLGIGTTNPTSTLHISGIGTTGFTGGDTSRIRIGDFHWDDIYTTIHAKKHRSEWWLEQNSADNDGTDLIFYKSRGAPGAELPVQLNDNVLRLTGRAYSPNGVGIGTTITLGDWSGDTFAQVSFDVDELTPTTVYGRIDFRTAGVSRLLIKSSGNVGIGTTNPTSKLTVQGDVLVSGVLTAANLVGTALSISGISTIANFRITNVGTGATVGGIGVTYYGDGSQLTNIVSGYASTAGIATYAERAGIATNVIGGIASVTSLNVTGITTLASIVGTSLSITGISTIANFRITNVGTGATVGGIGVTYYGDGSNLTNIKTSALVGVVTYAERAGIATNVIGGIASVSQLYVSGITTLASIVGTSLSITGISTIANFRITNVGTGATVGGIGVVTYYGDGSNLTNIISGYATTAGITTNATNVIGGIASVTSLDVSGITTLRSIVGTSLSITGISTIANFRITNVGTGATVGGIGVTYYGDGSQLTDIKTSALVGVVTYAERAGIATNIIGGIASVTSLDVSGITTLRSIVGTSLSITGISTIANFRITNVGTGATVGGIGVTYYGDGSNLTNIISGYATTAGITTNATNVIGGIASITSLNVTGITTLASIVGTSLSITGISTLGVTSTTNLTSRQLLVTGITTLANLVGTALSISGISTIANFRMYPVGTGATVGGIGVTYYGDGSNLTNIISGYATTAGITTNATNVIGGIASITSLNVTGITTLASIVGTSLSITGISTIANFRITNVGTGATVGGIGVTYYGDGSNLTNIISGYATTAGITTNATNVIGGIASVSQLNVTGITTLASIVGTSLSITGISTIANFRITNVGTGATVGGIGVTYYGDGSNLTNIISGYATTAGITTNATNVIGGIASVTSLDVSGITTLRSIVGTSLSITGISTIANFRMYPVGTGATVGGIGVTYYGDGSNLTNIISGYATTAGITTNATNVIGGIASITSLNVTGITTLASIVGTSLSITGISTLGVTSTTNLTSQQLNVSGITTLGVTSTTNLTSQQLQVTGITTLGVTSTTNLTSQQLNVSGITTLGVTSTTNLTSQQLNVSGLSTFAGITTVTGTTLFTKQLNVSGVSTFAGITTHTASLFGTQASFTGVVTASSFVGSGASLTGLIPNTIENIDNNQLYYPLLSPVSSGNISSISASNNSLVFNPGTDSLGIGTTNPTAKLDVRGDVSITSILGIGTVIDIVPYDTLNSGTLSWEGSAGQLFSITNNLTTGSIFSVNDVSGIPSIDVDANGTIQLGPYNGNVGLGTTNPTSKLHVVGNVRVSGASTFGGILELDAGLRDFNGTVGVAGSILTSTGAGVSWSSSTSSSASISIENTTTNSTHYVGFSPVSTGTLSTLNVTTNRLTFNPSSGTLSATVFTSLSDRTQKEDIRPIENSIEIVKQLTGVRYNWKDNTNQPSIGLIAQDVEEVIPEVVVEMADGLKSVSYGNIVAVLIEAIKEQQVRIEELEDRLNA